jgi:ABC-type transporter Mla maintaining outer membrane lipid asymmetry permease subunit MlaE
MNYSIDNNVILIRRNPNLDELSELEKFLAGKKVSKLISEVNLEVSSIYVLKKHLGPKVELDLMERDRAIWNQMDLNLPAQPKSSWFEIDFRPLFSLFNIFSLKPNLAEQNNFWLKIFKNTLILLTLNNIWIIGLLFFGVAMAIAFITHTEFWNYGLELDSCKIVMYSGIKMLCPMMTNFILTSKTCTSLTSLIKSMQLDNEFKIMNMLNLPYYRVHLHPIFIACCIAGPIMNLVAIGGLMLGAWFSWILQGHPGELFFSLVNSEFSWDYIHESQFRAFLCSIAAGFSTILAGLRSGESFESMIEAINWCVTLSFILNTIIQAVVSISW